MEEIIRFLYVSRQANWRLVRVHNVIRRSTGGFHPGAFAVCRKAGLLLKYVWICVLSSLRVDEEMSYFHLFLGKEHKHSGTR